jgi:FHA domain-containing protein/uncharacterized protein DUF1707
MHPEGSPPRRATDREREDAVSRLKPQLIGGALSVDTFSRRIHLAYAAKTKDELAALFRDLPGRRITLAGLRRRVGALVEGLRPRRSEPRRVAHSGDTEELHFPPVAGGAYDEFLMGRSPDCHYVIPDPTVSRHHAALRRDRDQWLLVDLESKNGSAVNGWRVDRARVRPGDRILLGESRFVLAD